jgi:hypothetical protein
MHTPEGLAEFSSALGTWEQKFVDTWLANDIIQKPIIVGTDYSYGKDWHSNIPENFPLRASTTMLQNWNTERNTIFTSIFGVFAGFLNFAADKSIFRDLWTRSVQYLLSRFSMVRGEFENGYKRIVSNTHTYYLTGGIVGKDEKIILFVIIRYYIEHCFFFSIQYQLENDSINFPPGGFVAEPYTKNEKYNLYKLTEPKFKPHNEEEKVQWKLVPPILVCGQYSGMLSPTYIDFILQDAKTFPNMNLNKRNNYTAYTIPLHVDLEQKFREIHDKYEAWLRSTNIEPLKSKLLSQSKKTLKNAKTYYYYFRGSQPHPFSRDMFEIKSNYLDELYTKLRPANAQRLLTATTLEDLFLNAAGPYTKEEEARFAEQLQAERQELFSSQKKKMNNRLEEERLFNEKYKAMRAKALANAGIARNNDFEENNRVPLAQGPLGFGGRRKTRKHRRFTKKRKSTIRRRS